MKSKAGRERGEEEEKRRTQMKSKAGRERSEEEEKRRTQMKSKAGREHGEEEERGTEEEQNMQQVGCRRGAESGGRWLPEEGAESERKCTAEVRRKVGGESGRQKTEVQGKRGE
ncbi:hypothetical protein NDU88_011572 [Pleurodeles waltl]|uniref:Uncharacterized protein n=1 Tax=Pleurodeles waltl TaxID=8319 RepID=A0AAV7QXN2_PLEWA|nr:hypothetical protein NDU88_011572 [Pleurodeles waltl]